MSDQPEKELVLNTENSIALDEMLDIAGASELRTSLLNSVSNAEAPVLAGDKVERIDTAALQVLCSYVQLLRTQNKSIQWRNPSESLRHAAALLGLNEYLGLS